MNWESVKYIDPYLGIIQKTEPFVRVEEKLNFKRKCRPYQPPSGLETSLTLQDPSTPVILLLGGVNPGEQGEGSSSENMFIFNPEKNKWSFLGPMPEHRNYHAGAYIRGYVYITGGNDPNLPVCERLQATKTVFRLNIRSKRWKKMTDMKFARSFHSVAATDDHLFAFGGRDDKGSVLFTVEKYNPEADQWTVVRSLPEPRMGMACTMCDGLVWLIGGMSYPGDKDRGLPISDKVTCYDPVKNDYYRKTSLKEPRAFCGAATVYREVWLFGGLTSPTFDSMDLVSVPWVDVYDKATQQWERRHSLQTPKHSFAIAKSDHRIYLFGGMCSKDKSALAEVDMYDKKDDKVVDVASLPSAVSGSAAVGIPMDLVSKEGSKAFSSGAQSRNDGLAEERAAEIIQNWSRGYLTRERIRSSRRGRSPRKTPSGDLGSGESVKSKNEAFRRWAGVRTRITQLDDRTFERVNIPSWPAPTRALSSSVSITCLAPDSSQHYGKILQLKRDGESSRQRWRKHYINFLPENDPNLGMVLFLDNFYSRHRHTLGLRIVDTPPLFVENLNRIHELQDETLPMIITFGGIDPKDPLKLNVGRAVLRYHPLKDRWEYFGLMPEPRCHHTAAYLNGVIYIIGGYDPNLRDGGEMVATKTLFGLDVRSGKWKRYADMEAARAHHGSAVLNNQIVCIGGRDHRGRLVASVEVYDPTVDTWQQSSILEEGKMGMGVAVCNGIIWMLGGATARSENPHEHFVVSTVECFNPMLNEWTRNPSLRVPRAYASAVVLNNGKDVWIVGGSSGAFQEKNYLESMGALDKYDPDEGVWRQKGNTVTARHCAAVVALDDCMYLIGGMSSQEWAPVSRTELYMPDVDDFYLPAQFPTALTGIAAVGLPPLVPTFRSESLSDMVRSKVGYPVPFLTNRRTSYRVRK